MPESTILYDALDVPYDSVLYLYDGNTLDSIRRKKVGGSSSSSKLKKQQETIKNNNCFDIQFKVSLTKINQLFLHQDNNLFKSIKYVVDESEIYKVIAKELNKIDTYYVCGSVKN